jgi:uncharacterized protein (TIGR03437 family)
MRALVVMTVVLTLAGLLPAEAPIYSADSLVNAADNQPGFFAPNTIATLYGKNLAYGTKALTQNDIRGGVLPTVLPGTGVRVLIGGLPANLYYVSPSQINFLIPANLLTGPSNLQIVIDGLAGPVVPIQLAAAAPALFQLDQEFAVATRVDGSVLTSDDPARPGDIVVLYANGLGQTVPPVIYGQLPTAAASLKQLANFQVVLDGVAVDPTAVSYAGIAPGFAGLYQINVRLPESTATDPEIRIALTDAVSKPGLRLPVSPQW